MAGRRHLLRAAGEEVELEVLSHERAGPERPGRLRARVDGVELECGYRPLGHGELWLELGGRTHRLLRAADGPARLLSGLGAALRVEPAPPRRAAAGGPPPEVTPPTPAVVVAVRVAAGQRVRAGEPVVVVSAMKMEATLVAPRDGVVSEVRVSVGDRVQPGDVLVRIDAAPAEGGEP